MDVEQPVNQAFSNEEQTEGMDLTVPTTSNIDKMDIPPDEVVDDKEESIKSPQTAAELPQKKKRKKTRKIKRSKEYPKFYKNAYVRYCDSVRPKMCEENPTMDPKEITKLVASKWSSLQKEEKEPYIVEALVDKQRFEKELKEYKSNNPEESSSPKKSKLQNKKFKGTEKNLKEAALENNVQSPVHVPAPISIPSSSNAIATNLVLSQPSTSEKDNTDLLKVLLGQNCEIPIFTDTFLEHNKVIETEVKALRKNNIEIEQQNGLLMKHIENMENGVNKVEAEIAQHRKKNQQLEVYLTKLRVILSANFNSLQIPGWKGGATVENIDQYVANLSKVTSATTLSKARDIIKKIDLQI